jgi:hypothetical protein
VVFITDEADCSYKPEAKETLATNKVFREDQGLNLEFKLVRTAPAPAGSRVQATCRLSDNKERDCPNL